MHTKKIFGSRRHVLTRALVATALLGSTFLVGLATTASAAPPYHLVIATPLPSTTDASAWRWPFSPSSILTTHPTRPKPVSLAPSPYRSRPVRIGHADFGRRR